MSNSIENFQKILCDFEAEQSEKPYRERDLCDPPTTAQLALDCLCDTFLGEDFYIAISENAEQVNTVILYKILYKHNKEFRKWYKRK